MSGKEKDTAGESGTSSGAGAMPVNVANAGIVASATTASGTGAGGVRLTSEPASLAAIEGGAGAGSTPSILEMDIPKQQETKAVKAWKCFVKCLSCCWGATKDVREVLFVAAGEALGGVLEDEARKKLAGKLTDEQLKAIAAAGKAGITSVLDNTAKRLDHLAETHGNADYLKAGGAISGVVAAGALIIPGADKVTEIARPALKKPIITDKAFLALHAKLKANGGKLDLSTLDTVEVLAYKQVMAAVKEAVNSNPDLTVAQKAKLNSTGAMSVLAIEFINQQNKLIASKVGGAEVSAALEVAKAVDPAAGAGVGIMPLATDGAAGTGVHGDLGPSAVEVTLAGAPATTDGGLDAGHA